MKFFSRKNKMIGPAARHFVLTESYTAIYYFERLIKTYRQKSLVSDHPLGKFLSEQAFRELGHSLYALFHLGSEIPLFSPGNFFYQMKNFNELFINAIKMPLASKQFYLSAIQHINLIYEHAEHFHLFLLEQDKISVPFPISEFLINKWAEVDSTLPLFYLDSKFIDLVTEDRQSHLEDRRNEKYQLLIEEGHLLMQEKKITSALAQFLKALNFKMTAEGNTLAAWCCAIEGNILLAKDYLEKAMEIDINYGPCYNDYGNCLLTEGKFAESIPYFERAKRAYDYPHREYPFINLGRAYVLMKKYDLAINEFSLALTLAPHLTELEETIVRLQGQIKTKTNTTTGEKSQVL